VKRYVSYQVTLRSISGLPQVFMLLSFSQEVVKSKTKRELIVKFFNVGTIEEVMRMPRCKEKKAELILSLRPFTSWEDLVI